MITDSLHLHKLDGSEVKPGVILIGEPTPIPGTNTMRALASVFGVLAVIELKVTFQKESPRC